MYKYTIMNLYISNQHKKPALQKTCFLIDSVKAFQKHNTLWILKESKYVRLANTIYRVLRNSRTPLFLHRKSNHVFSLWQHIVLLTVRQYEGKSYRMFAEWLFEAYYLRIFLQLSHIPHYTTLQKFSSRINGTLLEKIISSFILLLTNIRKIFTGIDSTGFKITHASQYYTERTGLRRKYVKLSLGADVLQQIICSIKIRRSSYKT